MKKVVAAIWNFILFLVCLGLTVAIDFYLIYKPLSAAYPKLEWLYNSNIFFFITGIPIAVGLTYLAYRLDLFKDDGSKNNYY